MDKNTSFGLESFGKPTPAFANNLFYLYFAISKAFAGWLAYTHLIPKDSLYEVMGILMLLADPIALAVSKMFGCEPSNAEKNG